MVFNVIKYIFSAPIKQNYVVARDV